MEIHSFNHYDFFPLKKFPCEDYEKRTVHELNTNYSHINWTDFLNWNLNVVYHVNESETVVLGDVANFIDYVEDLMKTTSKRTVANYLAWRFIVQASKFLNNDLRELHSRDPLSVDCLDQTNTMYVLFVKMMSYKTAESINFSSFSFKYLSVSILLLHPFMFVDARIKNQLNWPPILQRKFIISLLKL